jgi:transcription termination/antitermination protein NusG
LKSEILQLEKHWFVFYTKSRQEKKVKELLRKAGFEVFLPLQTVVRQWSDRKKKVETPLFNSYIFVREQEHNLQKILQMPGIAWSIRYNGKPAFLRQVEMELIQRFLTSGLFIETESIPAEHFVTGDKATVIDGPLAGLSGIVEGEASERKFSVLLEGINQMIRVHLPKQLLKKLK